MAALFASTRPLMRCASQFNNHPCARTERFVATAAKPNYKPNSLQRDTTRRRSACTRAYPTQSDGHLVRTGENSDDSSQPRQSSTLPRDEVDLIRFLTLRASGPFLRLRNSPIWACTDASERAPRELLGTTYTEPDTFKDTEAAMEFMKNIGDPNVARVIASMPHLMFSELLRCLDPITNVSRDMEPLAGLWVGQGTVMHTAIGRSIDHFGVRRVHVLLLRRLLMAAQLRQNAGKELTPSDFIVLLRSAGAACDPSSAKQIWQLQHERNLADLYRNGSLYAEFIKARFLTEPLYTQYDPTLLRVRPIYLMRARKIAGLRQKNMIGLRTLRRNLLRHALIRKGQVRSDFERVNLLAKMLSFPGPARRVFRFLLHRKHTIDEDLLAAVMVALGRTGSFRVIRKWILWNFWRIQITQTRKPAGIMVSGGTDIYGPSSPMYPTHRLLYAIVDAFSGYADPGSAIKIVDFLSVRYNIPIDVGIWSRLLRWSYIHMSKPAVTEWKVFGFERQRLDKNAVRWVWDLKDAYNFTPSFQDHDVYIRWLIAQGHLQKAVSHMLECEALYRRKLAEVEDAFVRHAHAVALGVDVPQLRRALHRAQAEKDVMASAIETWCRRWIGRQKRPRNHCDDMVTQTIPQVVEVFATVLSGRKLTYRTASGVVELSDVNPVLQVRMTPAERVFPAVVGVDAYGYGPKTTRAGTVARWRWLMSKRRRVKYLMPTVAGHLDAREFLKDDGRVRVGEVARQFAYRSE